MKSQRHLGGVAGFANRCEVVQERHNASPPVLGSLESQEIGLVDPGGAEDNEDVIGAHFYGFTAWDLGNRPIGRQGDLVAVQVTLPSQPLGDNPNRLRQLDPHTTVPVHDDRLGPGEEATNLGHDALNA